MTSNIVRFDAVRTIPIATIIAAGLGVYVKFGPAFAHAMRLLDFTNDSNGSYMISFDGVTDNFPLLNDDFTLYDLTSDQDSNETFRYEKGSQLWIKSLIAPTATSGAGALTDTIYVAAVYGKGE